MNRRPLVMGVLNVTPDSFSDGGQFSDPTAALVQALKLIEDGADLLDIGGESTRPGAEPVDADQEAARVLPVIAAIRAHSDIPLSIDTMKPAVARAAMAAGATIWNDVSALSWTEDGPATAAALGCDVVLMHMRGSPSDMQRRPAYDDVVEQVRAYLADRAETAMAAGVARARIQLDPGIGFGKTLEHNLTLLAGLERIIDLGFPVVLGASRKRFVQAVDPKAVDPNDRLGGSLAASLAGARAGVFTIRTHDVRQTVQALNVQAAILAAAR